MEGGYNSENRSNFTLFNTKHISNFQFEYKWDLNAGVDVLYDCRRFLMYSYAFIYYLEEDNNVYIFETNLDDVEAKTDKLSVAMEEYMQSREADEDFWKNEAELRGKIVDSVS